MYQIRIKIEVTVAGESFLRSELNKVVREMRTRKSQITEKLPGFVLLRHEQLNEFTYDDSLGYWKDHVERKKALFKDVVRANVWAYNNTFKKFHKEGHAG